MMFQMQAYTCNDGINVNSLKYSTYTHIKNGFLAALLLKQIIEFHLSGSCHGNESAHLLDIMEQT